MRRHSLLVIDDDPIFSRDLKRHLAQEFDIGSALTPEQGAALLAGRPWDAVLLDVHFEGAEDAGLRLLARIKKDDPYLPVIMMSRLDPREWDWTTRAFGADAFKCVGKRSGAAAVGNAVREAMRFSAMRYSRDYLLDRVIRGDGSLVGDTPAMRAVRDRIREVAILSDQIPVLLFGETGTGKRLVAEAIHSLSGRRGQLRRLQIQGVADSMIAAEIRGHARGSFTGATASRESPFLAAREGTVLIDDFQVASTEAQAVLLGILDEKRVTPVGGNDAVPIDAKVIVAFNQEPRDLVSSGRLRADLYYRLCGTRIDLPPLRHRLEDIPRLLEFFAKRHDDQHETGLALFSDDAVALLQAQPWPGNVRELEKAATLTLFRHKGTIGARQVQTVLEEMNGPEARRKAQQEDCPIEPLGVIEQRARLAAVLQALERTGWQKSRAAGLLGISLGTLNNILREGNVASEPNTEPRRPATA